MEPAGSGATWTQARRVSIGQGESARVARTGSLEVISKVERTAVRRSLHRMVRCGVAKLSDAFKKSASLLRIGLSDLLAMASTDHARWTEIKFASADLRLGIRVHRVIARVRCLFKDHDELISGDIPCTA